MFRKTLKTRAVCSHAEPSGGVCVARIFRADGACFRVVYACVRPLSVQFCTRKSERVPLNNIITHRERARATGTTTNGDDDDVDSRALERTRMLAGLASMLLLLNVFGEVCERRQCGDDGDGALHNTHKTHAQWASIHYCSIICLDFELVLGMLRVFVYTLRSVCVCLFVPACYAHVTQVESPPLLH